MNLFTFSIGFSLGGTVFMAVLKIFGAAKISWFWVIAPLWVDILFFLGAFAVAAIVYGLGAWLDRS